MHLKQRTEDGVSHALLVLQLPDTKYRLDHSNWLREEFGKELLLVAGNQELKYLTLLIELSLVNFQSKNMLHIILKDLKRLTRQLMHYILETALELQSKYLNLKIIIIFKLNQFKKNNHLLKAHKLSKMVNFLELNTGVIPVNVK